MASLNRKPCIIALQLCTARHRTRGLPMHRHCWCGGLLVGKRVQEVWEKKRKKGKIILIINKKLTGLNNFGVFKVCIIRVRLLLFY